MPEANDAGTAAYVPWRTFQNTIAALAQHMPNRIDRTAFPGQSGGGQNQLLIAFKFFGLIDDDSKPTPALHALAVPDEGARKTAFRKLVEQKYADLFALNLVKTTPSEFAEQITKSYNVSGDTRLKATRFFLAAAAYLEIPVSPLLMRDKVAGNAGTTPRRRRAARPQDAVVASHPPHTPVPVGGGESKTVTLKSGGTLTLSASVGFFSLSAADRSFVFSLVERLEEYEQTVAE